MRPAPHIATLVFIGASFIASAAYAGSAEDGNAGLDALNRGSYSEAVRLFTRALKAGDLSKDDQEFAYLNRGKGYLGEHKKTLAIADFKKAAGLKPDDADVQAALELARTGKAPPASVAVAAPVPPPPPVDPDAVWGLIAKQLDTYWMEVDTAPISYTICRWWTPHQVIDCTGLGKNGKEGSATYELDPATGSITYRQTSGTPFTAAVQVYDNSYEIDIEVSGKYLRETYTPTGALTGQVVVELYDGSAWKTVKTETMVQATPATVEALGWKVGEDKTHSFWKDLGKAVAAGAVAGIVQGLQQQPQQ